MKTYKQWLLESENKPNWSITPKDGKEPLGFVPMQSKSEIEYRGLIAITNPSNFKSVTPNRSFDSTSSNIYKIKSEIEQGNPIVPPFLEIEIKNNKPYVYGHEGRTRVEAINQLYGNIDIPVILFVYIDGGKLRYNNKDIDKYISILKDGLFSQNDKKYVSDVFKVVEKGDNVSNYI